MNTKIIFAAALSLTAIVLGSTSADARPFGFGGGGMGMQRSFHFQQPYQRYSNSGISQANCWNAGCNQPYNRYSNSGISQANCWNAGCNQPYNQYRNVINP